MANNINTDSVPSKLLGFRAINLLIKVGCSFLLFIRFVLVYAGSFFDLCTSAPMKGKVRSNVPNINLNHIETEAQNVELEAFRTSPRKKHLWNNAEVDALMSGVNEFGEKSWKKILSKHRNVFMKERRIVDLVNKYKLIKRESSYHHTENRDWILLDEQGKPVENWAGEILIVNQRFPYDAAKKFAKRRIASGGRKFNITVREAQNIENVHTYAVEADLPRKIEMKKLAERRGKRKCETSEA